MNSERKRIYTLCLCILPLMVCSGLVYSMFSLYLFEVVKLTKTQIGLLYMVGSAMGLFFGPMLGRLSDRFGRKPVILACLASFAVIFVGYALGRSYAILFPIQILEGTTWVAIGAASTAYIADSISSSNRGWAMGVYQQVASVGWVIGPAVGGFLSDAIGSSTTFLMGAALVAVGLVLALFFVKEPERKPAGDGA